MTAKDLIVKKAWVVNAQNLLLESLLQTSIILNKYPLLYIYR